MLMKIPETLNQGYNSIRAKIDSDYAANNSIWQIFWTEALLDSRLEAGDTSLMAQVNTAANSTQGGQWYFNRVRPLCNMVSGFQRRNRKAPVIVPLQNADQQTADQLTKLMLGIYKRENIYETISEAFHQGSCITGLNLLQVSLDFTNDPVNGDPKVESLPFNCFYMDPYFRKLDLSDCNFIGRRTYLTHSAAASLLPEHYNAIMALPGNPTGTGRDGRFQYMPEAYGQTQQNRLAYDEYWYKSWRKQQLIIDKETGDTLDVSFKDNLDIDRFLHAYPQTKLIEQEIPTVRLAIQIQDRVFYDGPNPLGIDRMPFVAVVGYYNSMLPYMYSRIQGICRSLRDPQLLYNRKLIISADLLESQLNSGWIFKENAVIDVKHLFQTGQGRVIPLKQEAQMTDLQPIQPPQIPPSHFQEMEVFAKELNLVSGINEELMGSALDDKAGILSALRQGAGLTTLQPLFDRLDSAQILLTGLLMDVVKANFTPGKVQTMLEGEAPAPYFYNKTFGKYHCMVEQGFNTESQKQMQFAQLMQLKELGVAIPDKSLIDAATLQNKTQLLQDIEQSQQAAQQQQQQMMQAQIEELQAKIRSSDALAIANKGLGVERISRVQENQALAEERHAAAIKDDQLALLNLAKAMRELDGLDIEHMQRIVGLMQMLKAQENAQHEQTEVHKEAKTPTANM
jgi:hypothetical protein